MTMGFFLTLFLGKIIFMEGKKLRTLKQLAEKEATVWVYLDNRKVGKAFLRQAREEGFRCCDGSSLRWMSWFYVMALHSDMTVWTVSLFNWTLSFAGDVKGTPVRVDYEKYMAGEEDYLCHQSHFKGPQWRNEYEF